MGQIGPDWALGPIERVTAVDGRDEGTTRRRLLMACRGPEFACARPNGDQ